MSMTGDAATRTLAPAARLHRGWIIGGIVLLALVALLIAGWRVALNRLQTQVLAALGPEASLRELRIAWPGVVILDGLQLDAPKGWPSRHTLRAEQVRVVPALRSLASERAIVNQVHIEGAYVSARRTREGKLEILPTLIDRARPRDGGSKRDGKGTHPLTIDRITLADATVDFYDASVHADRDKPPMNLQLVDADASFKDLRLPELDARSALDLRSRVQGRAPSKSANAAQARDGMLHLEGWLQVATRESDLKVRLANVDLVALEPYLIKRSETGVKRGRLSLDVHSRVRERRLHAPGRLVLDDLHLDAGSGFRATFMGMPRNAVVSALKRDGDRIELDFTLEGALDDARFSLNETLATRVAVGTAKTLGISLADIVRDVGSFGGEALEATGSAIGKLFGKDEGDDADDAGKDASR